jgi:putative SOS response-associated peptidase YedK
MRWGLIQNWAKDPKIAYKTIMRGLSRSIPHRLSSSLSETALSDSLGWLLRVEESSRRQNPVLDRHEGRFPLRVRGLCEGWKDPAKGEWLRTCTIITGEPNEFVREIHTRMPVILPEEHREACLSGEAGKEVLVPYAAYRMKARPISARANSPKNDDAEIIVPVEIEAPESVSGPRFSA